MPTSTTPTLGAVSIDWLRTSPSTAPGILELAQRLRAEHPELPCISLATSSSIRPAPGKPTNSLVIRVADGDTTAVSVWAGALQANIRVDGAQHTLSTVIDSVGLWVCATVPEDQYPMDTAAFPLTASDFAQTLHGVPMAEFGEDSGLLMGLGHVPARRFLAAISAWPRAMYGTRYVLDHQDLPVGHDPLAPRHAWARGEAYPTRSNYRISWCEKDAPGAVPVTYVHVDDITVNPEDRSPLERCPACDRGSRSTIARWLPGRHDHLGAVHTCSRCTHQWPALDTHKSPGFHGGSDNFAMCLVCGCLENAACPGGCSWVINPLNTDLCSACFGRAPAQAWEDLAAAGYGTPQSTPGRDSWLVTEAMRGVPVPDAAQAWAERAAGLRASRAREVAGA